MDARLTGDERAAALGITRLGSPTEVAEQADVVSVHLALNGETRGLLGADFFAAMRDGAFFVNTSRGEVIDQPALAAAVRDKGLRAGLDVFADEPRVPATTALRISAGSSSAPRPPAPRAPRVLRALGWLLVALVALLLGMALPWWAGLQFAPAAALLGLALAYPLWSWRRLSAAAHFLRLEMENLQRQGLAMRLRRRPGDSADFLERRINAVERASRQLRDLHQFVSESLQQLPSPTIVCAPDGEILLANQAARQHLGGTTQPSLQGLSVVDLLADLVQSGTDAPIVTQAALQHGTLPEQAEGTDAQGRSLLVQCKPFTNLANAGWLLTLVDLTEMRRALQQRDQAMHFISHDIRAPNASILTLLEMQRAYPGRLSDQELLERIERYAQASLGMAESFVQLASAQSQPYRMAPLDLAALLSETTDDLWTLARDRNVDVRTVATPDSAPCLGDRALLSRALTNVIHNAIKFSPDGGTVQCAIVARGAHWVVSVRDQGPGIAPEQQGRLFTPYQRLHDHSHPAIAGVGLGLALVQTVVLRHGGTLEVDSDVGRGAEFRLVLPQQLDAPSDDDEA